MTGGNACVRIDEDEEQGGFVFSSTIRDHNETVFYTYEEVHHFFERVDLGYFDGVAERARAEAMKFKTNELTPLNVEHASRYDEAPVDIPA